MAAKRKYPPIPPPTNVPFSQLVPTLQNEAYVRALVAYGRHEGPNPGSKGDFNRAQIAAETKA